MGLHQDHYLSVEKRQISGHDNAEMMSHNFSANVLFQPQHAHAHILINDILSK